jgi:preprotein translocase subunit SecB
MTTEQKTNSGVNFAVHNIYIQDASFEAPNSPRVFTLEWNPKLDFDIQMARHSLDKDLYDVVMTITVKVTVAPIQKADEPKPATTPEPLTAFVVEVKQAGIFLLSGVSDDAQLDYVLSTTAPTILFPYAREAISSLVSRGGFPQLIIPPMNFEAMYEQHVQQQQGAVANA